MTMHDSRCNVVNHNDDELLNGTRGLRRSLRYSPFDVVGAGVIQNGLPVFRVVTVFNVEQQK